MGSTRPDQCIDAECVLLECGLAPGAAAGVGVACEKILIRWHDGAGRRVVESARQECSLRWSRSCRLASDVCHALDHLRQPIRIRLFFLAHLELDVSRFHEGALFLRSWTL